jgi:hypothetical protein
MRINRTISSADSQVNDRVDFEVLDEIKVEDVIVIARGAIAWGTVTEAHPKKRMGRGGKLNVNIDAVRLASGEKAALRAVKDVAGGGHAGAMTGAIVATSIVFFPAAPLFLLMHGKDITIPKGTEITAYINGDIALDKRKFAGELARTSSSSGTTTPVPDSSGGSTVAIKSNPDGADITVDGKFAGNTPSKLHLAVGDHTIAIEKPGFRVWERTMAVGSSSELTVEANLEKGTGRNREEGSKLPTVIALVPSDPKPDSTVARITLENFERLQNGMSYSEVKDILRQDGKETARSNTPDGARVTYRWQNGSGLWIEVIFENGHLVSKSQSGLQASQATSQEESETGTHRSASLGSYVRDVFDKMTVNPVEESRDATEPQAAKAEPPSSTQTVQHIPRQAPEPQQAPEATGQPPGRAVTEFGRLDSVLLATTLPDHFARVKAERTGALDGYEKLKKSGKLQRVPNHSQVQVISSAKDQESGEVFEVKLTNGKTAWIESKFLK